MTETESEILKKIKKLLALSKDRGNVHEAELAAQKAQELLMRFNLDQSQAENFETIKKEPIQTFRGERTSAQNLIQWKARLAHIVSIYNLCKIYYSGPTIIWVGTKSNTEVAKYIYDTLCYDLEKICNDKWRVIENLRKIQKAYPQNRILSFELEYVHGKTWKNSFYDGAVVGISQKLEEQWNRFKTNTNMNALIVQNDKALEEYYGNLHISRNKQWGESNNFSSSAYTSGKIVGHNIQFKKGVTTGGSLGPKQLKG